METRIHVIPRTLAPSALALIGLAMITMIIGAAPRRAAGQDESAPDPAPPAAPPVPVDEIEIEFRGGVWLPRLKGEITFGGETIDVETQLDLDNMETIFNGEFTLRKNDAWQLRAGGFDFDTESTTRFTGAGAVEFGGLTLNDGDEVKSSVDITSIWVEVGHPFLHPYQGEPADLRFSWLLGARYLDISQDLEVAGEGSVSPGGDWLAITGGVELLLRYEPEGGLLFARAFTIDAWTAIGPALGSDGGWVWQLGASATLEITPNIGVFFGYRLLEPDVETEDGYEFAAGLQGLFLGGTIRF